MKRIFVSIMKWVAPIVVVTLASVELAGIHPQKWLGISILIATAILYTAALITEKKLK